MAQTSYTPPQAVTLATRAAAYQRLALALLHFDPLNLNLVGIVVNADHTVTITVSGAVPDDQLDHLGLR